MGRPAARTARVTNGDYTKLVLEVRGIRARLDDYRGRTWPTKAEEWSRDLDAYDAALLALADMLGLPTTTPPPGARRRLLPEERAVVEERIASRGIDVGGRLHVPG